MYKKFGLFFRNISFGIFIMVHIDTDLCKMIPHRFFNLIAFAIRGTGAGNKNNVVGGALIRLKLCECRPDHSAAPITFYCFADLF